MTATAGAPVADNQNSITDGPRGPALLQDWQRIEKLAHQNRERIPERVDAADGAGSSPRKLAACGTAMHCWPVEGRHPGNTGLNLLRCD